MTKKHFKLLAEAISEIENNDERRRVATSIGRVCFNMNEQFDWLRWSEACDVPYNSIR